MGGRKAQGHGHGAGPQEPAVGFLCTKVNSGLLVGFLHSGPGKAPVALDCAVDGDPAGLSVWCLLLKIVGETPPHILRERKNTTHVDKGRGRVKKTELKRKR